ncbi:hypothetical protein [Nostoc sp. NIES-3756]|nr:hypothetical protein [Nostoc sp. NIES-3756]
MVRLRGSFDFAQLPRSRDSPTGGCSFSVPTERYREPAGWGMRE